MKTRAFYKTMTLLVTLTMFLSCVDDDDFEIPETSTIDPIAALNLTAEQLKSVPEVKALFGGGDNVEIVSDIYLQGYVVSSDAGGNFFEELYVQDDPTNPTAGIRIALDQRDLYLTYDIGRKIVMKLQGYYIGLGDGDVITIGQQIGEDIEGISELEIPAVMTRSNDILAVEGLELSFADINASNIGMFVTVSDVQINRTLVGAPYVNPNDSFDTQRALESCADGSTFIMETSSFADFKQVSLPQGSGTISGIITQDFFGEVILMALNEAADFSASGERCDPDILECDGPTSTAVTVFEEDFQDITNESQLDALGWTNVNVSGGSERYEDSAFSGDRYMKISAFGTGENPLEAWLVTPAINLDSTNEEELSFDVSANFETGTVLSAFITENYTGDPTTTEWTLLDVNIPVGTGGFGSFVTLTTNISCLNGDVNVAFKYLGADGGAETRYHIDDVKVTGSN